ncbi:PP2C family protein-serine/threonine phosphatase [Streptomyces sp. NPDC006654]|uniref:PP2C family protein-serine/threonine phosphatase n=1 Tax=Streptomyces sp. NPDC006654 TaxID=3156897 RepID=UPI0033CD0B31
MGTGRDETPLPHDLPPQLPQPELSAASQDDAELDDVDRALEKARAALDEEHDAVQKAADDMGYRTTPTDEPAVRIIPGQVQRAHEPQSSATLGGSVGLSRTTTNNPLPSPELSVPITSPPEPLSADHLRFIGAATRRIARGIDLDEIVLGLCRATVPTFSDAIIVYLRDPLPVGDERVTGPVILRLRRVDQLPDEDVLDRGLLPMQDHLLPGSRLIAKTCGVRPGGALAEVLKGVRPIFADTPLGFAALSELISLEHPVPPGQRIILAPLRGRRRIIGAAVFLRRADRPAFEADDLLVAAPLATHTALGIDKAALYGREAYLADELQRTMLPESLPRPDGMRLASRYLPAADTSRVGGDWYDVIPLPGARVALVIGDVMGHSMTSAAVMGQLRSTLKTLAQQDLAPYEVLHQVDDIAHDLGTDRMATCLCAVYDPVAHQITIANAGHPPPLLLQPDGNAEILRVPSGIPLGVGGADFEEVELDAPALGTLLLYTDGLVESRVRDVWTGIEQLREKLGTIAQPTSPDHPPSLEALCDEVLDMLGPGDRDDDTALLAVRFDGIPAGDVASWHLEPTDAAPQRARQFAQTALDQWQLGESGDLVGLLVEEVVRSAVRQATRPITVKLLRRQVIRCEVGDDTPRLQRLSQMPPMDDLLHLLNSAHRWGTNRLSTGKILWFEVAIP